MKRYWKQAAFLAVLAAAAIFITRPQAQAPTKLFDVSNGNGAVISGTTVTRGTIIWYRDNEAKNKVMQAFADAYGYQATVPNPAFAPSKPEDPVTNPATIPNPQGQQAFFNKQISNYIRDVVKGQIVKTAAETAAKTAADAEEADLPTRTAKP